MKIKNDNAMKVSHDGLTRSQKKKASEEEKYKDNMVVGIIRGLDILKAQATSANLGSAARILHEAKKDLVYWAVEKGFHETAEEKFINQHLYNNEMFAATDFIGKLGGIRNKKIQEAIWNSTESKNTTISLVESLRCMG